MRKMRTGIAVFVSLKGFAIVRPDDDEKLVIARRREGGHATISRGEVWIEKDPGMTLPRIRRRIAFISNYLHPNFDLATAWCSGREYAEQSMRIEQVRRELEHELSDGYGEITDLMMPDGLCPSGGCGAIEAEDTEDIYATWMSTGKPEKLGVELADEELEPTYGMLGKFVELFAPIPAF